MIVPNQPQDLGNDQAVRDYRRLYATELWSGLQANGVNFIPADINAVRLAIAATPGAFGFQFIGTNNPACTPGAAPLDNAFSLFCSPANLVSPDAGQTHLFADDSHLTSAGHKIFGDYFYSLVAAPSQISMLAEAAVKTRSESGLVGAIQNQMMISQRGRARSGWNVWVTGDTSQLDIDGYKGFPDGVGSASGMIVAGADYRVAPGLIVGGALSSGRVSLDFNRPDGRDGGGFSQDEITASAYLAYAKGPYRFDLIGTYGHLDYDIDRVVPLGIASFAALGETSGSNVSLAATAGYDLKWGLLTHGPYVGLTLQRVHVDGFTETSTRSSGAFLRRPDAQLGGRCPRIPPELGPGHLQAVCQYRLEARVRVGRSLGDRVSHHDERSELFPSGRDGRARLGCCHCRYTRGSRQRSDCARIGHQFLWPGQRGDVWCAGRPEHRLLAGSHRNSGCACIDGSGCAASPRAA